MEELKISVKKKDIRAAALAGTLNTTGKCPTARAVNREYPELKWVHVDLKQLFIGLQAYSLPADAQYFVRSCNRGNPSAPLKFTAVRVDYSQVGTE